MAPFSRRYICYFSVQQRSHDMSMSNTTKRVKEIRRKTQRKFSSEEKIRIVLDGLRGEYSIAELCRREKINSNLYCHWVNVPLSIFADPGHGLATTVKTPPFSTEKPGPRVVLGD